MSKGMGIVERRIAELFAATRDRALSIADVTDHAFKLKGRVPTRAQRISATRAAHRLLRRVREAEDSDDKRVREWALHVGCFGRIVRPKPGFLAMEFDHWQATTLKGRLYFNPPDVPVQVWAVTIDHSGVHWFDAEVTKITERNVMVRHAGATARLDRERLWYWWAFWRRVRFVSSRTGRIAAALDDVWHRRYGTAGAVPPSMRMSLERARLLLNVGDDYTREDVIAAFRRKVKEAHPDVGGTAEQFRLLVEARDRLLSAIGTEAPAPKMPEYAPTGSHIRYGSGRSRSARLGSNTRLLA
jgi:hypothetical protein